MLLGTLLALCSSSGCTIFGPARTDNDLVALRQLTLRGAEAMQRGDAGEAERCFTDAIAQHPQDERCHVLLAELRKRQGRMEESTEHLAKAVELSGEDPRLLVQLGGQYYELGAYDAAMDCVSRALRRDASSATAWLLYARLLLRQEEYPRAIIAYHRSLQIDANQPDAALELADVYLREGRIERCLSTLDSRACSMGETAASGRTDYLRGLAYAQIDRHADAVASLAEAERKGVREPELYYQLAISHHQMGSPASARLALTEFRRLAPGDRRFHELAQAIEAPKERVASLPNREGGS